MMMDGMGGMVWWMVLSGLLGLALLVLAILGIIWLARGLIDSSGAPPSQPDPAEDEVRRLYAAGEIGREEYQRRITDLRGR